MKSSQTSGHIYKINIQDTLSMNVTAKNKNEALEQAFHTFSQYDGAMTLDGFKQISTVERKN